MSKSTRWSEEDLQAANSRLERARHVPLAPKKAEPIKLRAGRKSRETNQLAILKEKQQQQLEGVTRVNIKPLSVNEAYRGRRFKTKEHTIWKQKVMMMLPFVSDFPASPYEIYLKFGYSSNASDWDNGIKCAQDAIATKYKFNDKLIKRGIVETEIVPKGKEYFEFSIKHYKVK